MRAYLSNLLSTCIALSLLAASGGAAAQAPEHHETLTIAVAKPAGNLDPHDYKGLWGVQDLIFEPLVKYGKSGEILPSLAVDWLVKQHGRSIRLELRENVTFQDGTPWNAESMVWNLKRWIGKERHSWMNLSRLYRGVEIIDSHTLEIHFKEPVLGLLYELSYVRPVRFLSPQAVDDTGAYVKPIGTGPWIQTKATNAGISFERFDGYWGDLPEFEHLELRVIPDSRSRVAALRAGEIDLTGGDFLAPMTAHEAETLQRAGVDVTVESGTTTVVLGFNPDRAPALADPRVRHAISLGFDRHAIAKVLFRGLAEPAGNLFAEQVPFSGKRFEVHPRDVAKAATLLEEAGWTGAPVRHKDGKPLSLELVVSEEQIAGSRSVAEVMQSQLREIGIDLSIRSVDHASRHSDIPARKYDMAFFLTFGAPYEPYGTVQGLFLSTYDNGVDGKLFIDPEELDPLVNAALTATEDDPQQALQAVYNWLHENTAIAPLVYAPSLWAHTSRVRGFQPPATEYDTPYDGISLAE